MAELKLRPLTGQDTFKLLSIMDKLEVGSMFGGMVKDAKNSSDVQKAIESESGSIIGKLINSLTRNLPNMQDELNEFLADVYQTDIETIENLSFVDYNKLIIEFFQHEDFKDFLALFSSLTQ